MSKGDSPSYEQLFGDLDFRAEDDARSVYSPAAYLVDLLELLEGTFDRPSLLDRRPDLKQILLDAERTFTETPYLDIVNEVLEKLVGTDPYGTLKEHRNPFSLHNERLKKYLGRLQVTPEELYRLFAAHVDEDMVAREYLGLSKEDVTLLTEVLTTDADVVLAYAVAKLDELREVEVFARQLGITGDQVRELDGVVLTDDGHTLGSTTVVWLERSYRVCHLARRTGLSITDLYQVINGCAGGKVDLRTIAAAVRLHRERDLTIPEVCSLAIPVEPDPIEFGSGDILAKRNRDYRFRLAAAIGVSESDLVETVTRYRERYAKAEPSPFDHGTIGLAQISLLRRVGRLSGALGVSVSEFFDVLSALERDGYRVLEGGDPAACLQLALRLFDLATWMREQGFGGEELTAILGTRPEEENLDAINGVREAFYQVAFGPEVLESNRFGRRAAKVIHDVLTAYEGVVSPRDDRLLRLDAEQIRPAAFDAVTDLGVLAPEDLMGLGLGDRLTTKIFANLVHLGTLAADGTLIEVKRTIASDFESYSELLFKSIGAAVNGTASFFPSDLAAVNNMTSGQQAELYDNLIFNGYLTEEGDLTDPDFFLDYDNLEAFAANVDLDDVRDEVLAVLDERVKAFREQPLAPEIDDEKLLESLRFNGYIDQDRNYVDKAALMAINLDNFGLAIEFYPRRKSILDSMQSQIATFRRELFTFSPDAFATAADEAMAKRVVNVQADDLTEVEQGIVAEQYIVISDDEAPYKLSVDALLDLGFDEEEADQLLTQLVERGDLAEGFAVAWDRLDYFTNVNHALEYQVEGIEDYSTDLFFQIHTVALELTSALAEIEERLVEHAARQKEALYGALADAFGVPAAIAEAISAAVVGGADEAIDVLVAPVLAQPTGVPADAHFRLSYRRARRFALLAGKLGLDPGEIAVIFRDQDLVGKFPEHLALPPGLNRFDAVLPSFDGTIYLFGPGGYWTYSGSSYALTSPTPKALIELSPAFADLTAVDAAFTYTDQSEWIIGHGADGVAKVFVRQPGGTRWAPRQTTWGKVRNVFDEAPRIDSAYLDKDGKAYLFSGDQYVRYSTGDYSYVDEGFPRSTSEWWGSQLKRAVDASFQARDGKVHLFRGNLWTCDGTSAEISEKWGRVRNNFGASLDAAYSDGTTAQLFAGNQVIQYSDCLENRGVLADEGHPRLIHDVPPEFAGALEAAFVDTNGVLNLFKEDRTIALTGTRAKTVKTADRWGVLPPALPSGHVDAAFVGLDGKTYLFSGDSYLRYSTADYSVVDAGYPRAIAGDWGGLTRVDASFVMDGTAYLFGAGGLLFDLPLDWEPYLRGGEIAPELRNRFREYGLTPTVIDGKAPEWRVRTDEGLTVTVKREGKRIHVYGDGAKFYVRYSTRDFRTPDAGFPKPLSDNWWNLDLGPVDAVFTGTDGRTYLFSSGRFVWFDTVHRWWTEPVNIRDEWDSLLPFTHVDAAFVGQDGCTYVFSDNAFVRYSTSDYTMVDDGYPANVNAFWGNVANNLARTGKVDAALVMEVIEQVDGVDVARTYTYLFSGDQYVRYEGRDYAVVQKGYPRLLSSLNTEPGLTGLDVTLDGVDAAFSDRRNTYLFRGGQGHVVSRALYRDYPNHQGVTCAFIENGSVLTEEYEGWRRRSSLEERQPQATAFRPRTLRTLPPAWQRGLDAVLTGTDGNTYLFKGADCFNTQYNRAYPLAEEWGRPRNTIYLTGQVDAAFVGLDKKTYLFSGDQFFVDPDGEPQLIADFWSGLTNVQLAYVLGDKTYLFEQLGPEGTMRFACYEGADYATPVELGEADTSFWEVPDGFPVPDAVLVEGETVIMLGGEHCVAYDDDQWSYPRPIERIWRGYHQGLEPEDTLRTAFTAADGVTYFFFGEQYTAYKDGAFGPLTSTRERWGLSKNPFGQHVDAAFTFRGTTFLFSGDHYVRYSTDDYRFIDAGYPMKTSLNLRKEEAFSNFAESFEDALTRPIDAVVANDRTVYVFAGGNLHVGSRTIADTVPLSTIGYIRNNVADGKVDAAFTADGTTYLFSGDQYVAYSRDFDAVDDGFPKPLSAFPVPAEFEDGVDAAFKGLDGRMHFFRGKTTGWGRVRNAFTEQKLDAAFLSPAGELYAFSGGQFIRYLPGTLDTVEEGFPRTVLNDWGDLPTDFEEGPDGAFVFEGRTYLLKNDQYVRYSGPDYHQVDRTFPQDFRLRWSDLADYRLSDVRTAVDFAALTRKHQDGLADFLYTGTADPYLYLAALFGWDLDEIRWARRRSELLIPDLPGESLFEIEFLLKLVSLFATAGKLGKDPSACYTIWSKVYTSGDLAGAAAALMPDPESALGKVLHGELNELKRDALAGYLSDKGHGGSRELFKQLLIDVDMGAVGATSRVREAIAATQLFLHRYLLDLEEVTGDTEEIRRRIKTWWTWMKNYRIWEANRKVFLYPENYLRPELRDTKTPAFQTLENDLLQAEITAEAVQKAYKKYLDEYTEVSRLAIAGGYVYSGDEDPDGLRRLVLFGRTRTDPMRYYFRSAVFRDGEKLSASWDAWQKVDVQIESERVDPVHAFGRVFAFWTVVENTPPANQANTTIVAKKDGDNQKVSAPPPTPRVKIFYAFRNLNGEWSPAQLLADDVQQDGPISGVSLYVQASRNLPGGPVGAHDSIVVQCTYTVARAAGPVAVKSAFTLTPELYALRATGTVAPARPTDLSKVFVEPVPPIVRFNAPADTPDGPWFSVDHKGGSFLCRPVSAPYAPSPWVTLGKNPDRLPTNWAKIDAAFTGKDGTMYFFDNSIQKFIGTPPPDKLSSDQTKKDTTGRWGNIATNLLKTGVVDAAMVKDGAVYLFSGTEYYRYSAFPKLDPGYPKLISDNTDNLPAWQRIDFVIPLPDGKFHFGWGDKRVQLLPNWLPDPTPWKPPPKLPDVPSFPHGNGAVTFDNKTGTYTLPGDKKLYETKLLGVIPTKLNQSGIVKTVYVSGEKVFMTAGDSSGDEFYRYTFSGNAISDYVDAGYPKPLPRAIDAAFRGYVFSGSDYAPMNGHEPDAAFKWAPIQGNWRGLPKDGFDSVLTTPDALYFFQGTDFATYSLAVTVVRPYEIAALPNEIIRLTSSTAYQLNRALLTGGVPALLAPETQQIDELPRFTSSTPGPTTIRVTDATWKAGVPISSHLDFQSSNGIYYWEIFFHAPLLIAQALNDAQRFEDARTWYEYVFDPTNRGDYWRFLPFLSIDIAALVAACRAEAAGKRITGYADLLKKVELLAPAFQQVRPLTTAELTFLADLANKGLDTARGALPNSELVEMLAGLRRQYDLLGDRDSLVEAYLNDPFDPHAIAGLRPVAYRRAVVMAYIDNLLDWGDMLFRQYTGETIDEARMLYIFAYDLLGERPYLRGPRTLPVVSSYEQLTSDKADLPELTAGGVMVTGDGVVHESVTRPYFYVPDNSTFHEYWTRVEDRLRKIRQSLDIMGISRPVPLFEPPADVMALVRGRAAGVPLDQLTAGPSGVVPSYRFGFLFRKAQDLVGQLRQFGGDLLGQLERKDMEELSRLQNRQEAAILTLTRSIREAQVKIAQETLAEMRAARDGAQARADHYDELIAMGLSPAQIAQITMMSAATVSNFVAAGIKIAASIAYATPEVHIGPFIMGFDHGGQEVGNALNTFADTASTFGQGFSSIGEILGIRAEQDRTEHDWHLQLGMAKADLAQLGHQITGAELQVGVAQRELEILNREAVNLDAVHTFLTDKFTNAQLYTWMTGRLSGMFFQSYHLAYELARSAERAYQFERGTTESFIQPTYWESKRNGLLAGEGLAVDLERLGVAFHGSDRRALEITKKVSLLAIDPLALLNLRSSGSCDFALTEALFDRDFPGHFRRQLKTVTVTFETGDGPVGIPATLTQLDNKVVLSADTKAVKFLLDPKGLPPSSLRADWRPSQQIALGDIEDYVPNNGLFELRFDDDRYLPFEGTGAISRWRLTGRPRTDLTDVTITVKYTAQQGGETFATAVKGMLKPFPSARFFDVSTEFADAWAAFTDSGTLELSLTPDLLPGISGRQITGLFASYGGAEVTLLLNGDRRLALTEGKLLKTPGLNVGGPPWTFVAEGDTSSLATVGLIVAYRAH